MRLSKRLLVAICFLFTIGDSIGDNNPQKCRAIRWITRREVLGRLDLLRVRLVFDFLRSLLRLFRGRVNSFRRLVLHLVFRLFGGLLGCAPDVPGGDLDGSSRILHILFWALRVLC